jgi:hypothetical protein
MVGLVILEDGDGQRQSILVGGRGEIVRVGVMTCGSKVGYCERKVFDSHICSAQVNICLSFVNIYYAYTCFLENMQLYKVK